MKRKQMLQLEALSSIVQSTLLTLVLFFVVSQIPMWPHVLFKGFLTKIFILARSLPGLVTIVVCLYIWQPTILIIEKVNKYKKFLKFRQ